MKPALRPTPKSRRSIGPVVRRNKWWSPAHTSLGLQWESRIHPDFLFVAVHGCQFVSRTGNRMFDLMGTKPETIFVGQTPKEAQAFARKWIKTHSGRDYCVGAHAKFKAAA